ncbi:MarR family winged helix-turn-helix transcriptional regulator [Kitasatospora sp. DSM 101779]|uniref:MarR family winged helix-turn-helix transcriptional regulator n=1 Tax=Kitasatospora sp. DSM 101779 TaxID=2853165 RepID=UPI0021D9EEC8|nr:MarR family transcriptional regulator [Kitasatospora sp. DSM 101779]MCU7821326.1 MarR family transcriptional regulator [Kitasatospora sp. DSM 101779]
MEIAPEAGGAPSGARRTAAELAAAAERPAVRELGLLLRAAARLDRAMDTAMRAECGLSHTMFEVLLMLARARGEGIPQRELAEGLTLTSGGTTRLVDRMEQAGLVRRAPSPADRRITLVGATPEGAEAFGRAAEVHARIVDRLLVSPVAADDRAPLLAALRAIVENPEH